jgi:CheY-like chemotaxis protein
MSVAVGQEPSRDLPMLAISSAFAQGGSTEYRPLAGKRILVVDDEAVICVDYLFQLREIGARPEGFVSTNAAALTFLETHPVDAAILDYRLPDGTSEPLMAWLQDHQIPFVIISGWVEKVGPRTSAAPVLEKPAPPAKLWRALSDVLH